MATQSFDRKSLRARRKPGHIAPAEDLSMGELRTHYNRLCRVGNVAFWKLLFSGGWQAFAGAFIGGAIAHASQALLVALAVATVGCFLGWVAVRDTEAESVKAIREDYKTDILDSIELVEVVANDEVES